VVVVVAVVVAAAGVGVSVAPKARGIFLEMPPKVRAEKRQPSAVHLCRNKHDVVDNVAFVLLAVAVLATRKM